MKSEKIALFDMDGTLCDYDKSLFEGLKVLRGHNEPIYISPFLEMNFQKEKKRAGYAYK